MAHLLHETKVHGCLVYERPMFEDVRGSFFEVAQQDTFKDLGLPTFWPQDNYSNSKKDVLRGLHIQRLRPQGKLVSCLSGAIFDVCLDLRRDSPTFLKWHGELLVLGKSMYCPPGTAHGFLALEDNSSIYYKCTTLYDKGSDGGVFAFDPDMNIEWPLNGDEDRLVMSDKDMHLPMVSQWLNANGSAK